MKLSVILVSFLIVFTFLNQSFAEVYTTGSAADNNGNIIVIGYCLGNIAIGGEQFNITTPSAFILKLNSDGEKIWVKFINSTQSIKSNAVAVDSAGNIYLTGEFSGTASFGSNILLAQNTDAFIVKLNVDGEVEWVKQGASANTATGNDIFVKDNFVYVCGDGTPITFDSLSIGGGFTVIYNLDGSFFNFFRTQDKAYKLTIDKNNDIILYTGAYSAMWHSYYPLLDKFSQTGNNFWTRLRRHNQSLRTDINDYTFSLNGGLGDALYLEKFDTAGNVINSTSFGVGGLGKDLTITYQNILFFCGNYTSGFQFGNTTLQSNGSTDFFIASVDTNLNPLWIKHGGGSYDDELNSIFQLNDGNIVCSGNFKGTISIDTMQITGGLSADDKWVGMIKYDVEGNRVWFKKIVERLSVPSEINWFPLEVGNKFQYFGNKHDYYDDYFTQVFQILDSVWVNNKKYFSVNGFGTGNLLFRYAKETQILSALYQNQEYTFMDFSKTAGETFQQIQSDGSFRNTTVVSKNIYILGDTIAAKGYYNILIYGGPPNPYVFVYIWRYFAPEIGWILQDEECGNSSSTDLFLIEYLINSENEVIHKKHSESVTLNFQPVSLILEGDSLNQDFTIQHPFSKQNEPSTRGFFTYVQAYLQSFYFNGNDTIWNSNFNITQTNAIDYSLDYQFDSTKYNQGYHLYYRIAAVDKGIIADTFYSPQTGYYKLFWKDSTTSVTQTEFEALTYSLSQNYPNPFNPVSKIVFTIPKRENVSLKVYDILGSEITTLVNKELEAGKYEVDFSGKDLSSGIYIYQIKAGAFRETKKMILMR